MSFTHTPLCAVLLSECCTSSVLSPRLSGDIQPCTSMSRWSPVGSRVFVSSKPSSTSLPTKSNNSQTVHEPHKHHNHFHQHPHHHDIYSSNHLSNLAPIHRRHLQRPQPSKRILDINCHLSLSATGLCTPLISKCVQQKSKLSRSISLLFTLILISIVCITRVTCINIFELRIDEFVNELNQDASGRCCYEDDSEHVNGREICQQKCQTNFHVSLINYQANINTKSQFLYGKGSLRSNPRLNNHTIRIKFDNAWPGTFSLIIDANVNAPASDKYYQPAERLISRIYESRSRRLDVSSRWTQKVGRDNRTILRYSYRVLCDKNYYGNTCSVLCRPSNDYLGHYSCDTNGKRICHEGWQGEYCSQAVCGSSCNQTNAECKSPGMCQCRPGWSGENCNQCDIYPNCQHGYCNKPWECICREGWGGLLCNLDLNYCTNHLPCKNGGTCTNTGEGSFTCQCPPGFAGKQCEIEVNSCDHFPCLNGGTCKSHASANYTCECPLSHYGRHCEHLASACLSNPCDNHGTCIDGPSGFQCVCKRGYSGNNCEIRQKNCEPNPCVNGANCIANSTSSNDEGYTCQCRAGFSGDHCEQNINDCESNPCLNSGTCIDEVNSFRCQCVPGYVGELCQVNVDDCLIKPCANGGSCIDRNNDYLCICPPGYTGKDCSINIDDCASNPCFNGGFCQDRVNEFECICLQNFSGARCELSSGASLLVVNSTSVFSAIRKSEESEDQQAFSSSQLFLVIFGSISLPLIAIIFMIVFFICKQWRQRDMKIKTRRDDDEARRQNEHNSVMSGMNNKCLDQCLNPSAANVIVNALDRPASMYHINKCHKVSNEYVYGRQFDKSATLHKGFKVVNSASNKVLNTDLSVKLSMDDPYNHTYEHIQKPSNLCTQQIYSHHHSPKKSNLDVYEKRDLYTNMHANISQTKTEDSPQVVSSRPSTDLNYVNHHHNGNSEPNSKRHGNLQNNIQISATLQRMGCRSNSLYVIEDHYSQPIYGDPKNLQATEV